MFTDRLSDVFAIGVLFHPLSFTIKEGWVFFLNPHVYFLTSASMIRTLGVLSIIKSGFILLNAITNMKLHNQAIS